MNDPYPQNIEIKINREALCRYYRLDYFKKTGYFAFAFLVLIAFAGAMNVLEEYSSEGLADKLQSFLILFIGCILLSELCILAFYWVYFRRISKKRAEAFSANVEGDFLRLKFWNYSSYDVKTHFSTIVDYSVRTDHSMKKCGISMVCLRTTGATNPNMPHVIPGVENAVEVRDMLADIDASRERN